MQLETMIRETPLKTDRLVSKVFSIGKAYTGIRQMIDSDQKDSFSKLYVLMQTKDAKIGLSAQSQMMEEISENPKAYNFDFIASVLESPGALSRNVPIIYKNDSRREASERLIGEYFGEKLVSRISSNLLKNISYN